MVYDYANVEYVNRDGSITTHPSKILCFFKVEESQNVQALVIMTNNHNEDVQTRRRKGALSFIAERFSVEVVEEEQEIGAQMYTKQDGTEDYDLCKVEMRYVPQLRDVPIQAIHQKSSCSDGRESRNARVIQEERSAYLGGERAQQMG